MCYSLCPAGDYWDGRLHCERMQMMHRVAFSFVLMRSSWLFVMMLGAVGLCEERGASEGSRLGEKKCLPTYGKEVNKGQNDKLVISLLHTSAAKQLTFLLVEVH